MERFTYKNIELRAGDKKPKRTSTGMKFTETSCGVYVNGRCMFGWSSFEMVQHRFKRMDRIDVHELDSIAIEAQKSYDNAVKREAA